MHDSCYSLADVADRLAIDHVIARYVHAIDSRDYDTLDDVFHPDCVFDISDAGGANAVPWPELKVWYVENLTKFEHYFHSLTNLLVEFDDDLNTARSVCKVINPCGMRTEDGAMHFFEITGHWHDRWARGADGWRIIHRRWQAGWVWGDFPFAEALAATAGTHD